MDHVGRCGSALHQLECMEDMEDVSISIGPCDKIDLWPIYLLKTICEDAIWRKTVNVSSAANLRHSIFALKLQICPRQWYTWRHNKVLKEVVEATKMEVARANSRKIVLQRKVYFLLEGFSISCKKNKHPPMRDILAEANDWTVAADLEGLRRYSQVLRDRGMRPDVVLVSSSILVELTVPWEDTFRSERCAENGGILWPSEKFGG